MEHDVLLEMKNISKEFSGVKALDNVSLTVRKRNGSRTDGRKRRWEIYIDEVPVWDV